MKRYVKASTGMEYFTDEELENIGELVADNLTHMYRSQGADFGYFEGSQSFDEKTAEYGITVTCRLDSHYDPEIYSRKRYGEFFSKNDGKMFSASHTFKYNRYDTKDSMARQIVIILTDAIEDQILKGSGVMGSTQITASTDSNLKYADKVKFEDIYPTDHDIDFYFTSDDAAYAKEVLGEVGDVEGLVGFSIEVSLPKDYNGDWQEALIYISPKTSDGEGGASDSDWVDITLDISDADMKSLVEQSWDEYKKRGWDNPDSDITSSTKYGADMCSIGASDDDGFEQLAEGEDSDSDEYIEYGKFYVAGYLGDNYRGLMSDLYSDDFEEILSIAADMSSQGLFVEITNRADGRSERYTPEDFELAAENGEYPDHIREDLAL